MPPTPAGELDHNKALIGDDLREFVDQKLFPYLKGFKQRADRRVTIGGAGVTHAQRVWAVVEVLLGVR